MERKFGPRLIAQPESPRRIQGDRQGAKTSTFSRLLAAEHHSSAHGQLEGFGQQVIPGRILRTIASLEVPPQMELAILNHPGQMKRKGGKSQSFASLKMQVQMRLRRTPRVAASRQSLPYLDPVAQAYQQAVPAQMSQNHAETVADVEQQMITEAVPHVGVPRWQIGQVRAKARHDPGGR